MMIIYEASTSCFFINFHFVHGRKSFASRGPVGLELTTLLAGPASNSNELPHTDQTTSGHRLSGKGGQEVTARARAGKDWPMRVKDGQGRQRAARGSQINNHREPRIA